MFQYLELDSPGLTIEACIGKGRFLKLTFYQMEWILLASLTLIQMLSKSKSYKRRFFIFISFIYNIYQMGMLPMYQM